MAAVMQVQVGYPFVSAISGWKSTEHCLCFLACLEFSLHVQECLSIYPQPEPQFCVRARLVPSL